MRAAAALMPFIREPIFPNSRLRGHANLLVMPNQDAAHIAFSMARVIGKGVTVGPMLMGVGRPAHVLTPPATVRRVVNLTAIAVVDAQQYELARNKAQDDSAGCALVGPAVAGRRHPAGLAGFCR